MISFRLQKCATYFAELQSSLADRNTTNLSVASCEQNDLQPRYAKRGTPPSIAEVNAVVKGFCETLHAGATSTWVRIDPVDFYLGQDPTNRVQIDKGKIVNSHY